ncbi:MAG: hypothetical protein UHW99_03575 [Methanobrevibacter sp.]|nr:hypothetical protein [Methanobrevibacter sp.]
MYIGDTDIIKIILISKKLEVFIIDVKKVLFALLISALLIGGACAASVNNFKVDQTYKNVYSSDYYSVYADGNQNSGILIFKNVNDI